MSTRRLHLHLKAEYFDAIKRGEKKEEYRDCTNFYARQLANAPFAGIVLYRGYPNGDDKENIMNLSWRGYEEKVITHPHFGSKPTRVYAIKVAP